MLLSNHKGLTNISFQGPATRQVIYFWCNDKVAAVNNNENGEIWKHRSQVASIFLLVKINDDEWLAFTAEAVKEMMEGLGLDVLLMPERASRHKSILC
jgi:hypothetical protein